MRNVPIDLIRVIKISQGNTYSHRNQLPSIFSNTKSCILNPPISKCILNTNRSPQKKKKNELSSLQSTIPPCHENSAGLLSWDRMMSLPLWPTSNFTINSKSPQHNFTRSLWLINQMGTHSTAQVVFGNKVTKHHHHKVSQQKHGLCMGHSLTFYNIHIQS